MHMQSFVLRSQFASSAAQISALCMNEHEFVGANSNEKKKYIEKTVFLNMCESICGRFTVFFACYCTKCCRSTAVAKRTFRLNQKFTCKIILHSRGISLVRFSLFRKRPQHDEVKCMYRVKACET